MAARNYTRAYIYTCATLDRLTIAYVESTLLFKHEEDESLNQGVVWKKKISKTC